MREKMLNLETGELVPKKSTEYISKKEATRTKKMEKEHIFIIHAEDDVKIASAFHKMLDLILCPIKKYNIFRSSDDGKSIGSGDIPHEKIYNGIDRSNNVFCLLTNKSFNKPWILYEMGYTIGKSKDKDKNLMPIAIGVSDDELSGKPYYYLSVTKCTKEYLANLILKLLDNIHNQTDFGNEFILKESFAGHIDTFLEVVENELKNCNMRCPKCNTENIPNANFCIDCGKKLKTLQHKHS